MIFAVYVDDILLVSKKISEVFEVKEELCQEFEMVDKREVREVQQDGGTLGVYKEED